MMRAIVYDQFGGPLHVETIPEPEPSPDGAVIAVRATGICRSDWHGWQGHDPDITGLPHVPGHEFAGEIADVGRDVKNFRPGDRVTMPFVAGCGECDECRDGAPQVCDRQFQPGFTAWGSFAERVAVRYADFNLVRLPDAMDFETAASFGCRLGTAYRAVALQGRVQPGHWVAIHGSGGVGLSAVMVAAALGAKPIAIDINDEALRLAADLGAVHAINGSREGDVPGAIFSLTGRGADVSIDALGSRETAISSIRSLRKRGRHVQVGLLVGDDARPPLPMELVIARELEIAGSHGLAAADFTHLLQLATTGQITPSRLIGRRISLDEAPSALAEMGAFSGAGVTLINRF